MVRYGFRSVLNSKHGDFNGFFPTDFKHQNHETLGDYSFVGLDGGTNADMLMLQ